jgi:hypothetical protein
VDVGRPGIRYSGVATLPGATSAPGGAQIAQQAAQHEQVGDFGQARAAHAEVGLHRRRQGRAVFVQEAFDAVPGGHAAPPAARRHDWAAGGIGRRRSCMGRKREVLVISS